MSRPKSPRSIRVIDASTLDESTTRRISIAKNDVAEVTFCERTNAARSGPARQSSETTGRFVLVADRKVSGGGIVLEAAGDANGV